MKVTRLILLPVLLACCSLVVQATPSVSSLGSSITISDENYKAIASTVTDANFANAWYGNHEDNEVETNPDTMQAQRWDLEGMYLNSNSLTLVGGFNFQTGTSYGGKTYRSGDIFIDIDGDAKYGFTDNGGSGKFTSGINSVSNSFGYDYVIHFNSQVSSYSVFRIDSTAQVSRITDVPSSNPWQYVSNGTALSGYQNVAIGGFGLLSPDVAGGLTTQTARTPVLGLKGSDKNNNGVVDNNHFYLTVDTSFLPSNTLSTFHYTIECGNDNLMGRARTPVPDGGSTLIMLGGALALLFGLRRRLPV